MLVSARENHDEWGLSLSGAYRRAYGDVSLYGDISPGEGIYFLARYPHMGIYPQMGIIIMGVHPHMGI